MQFNLLRFLVIATIFMANKDYRYLQNRFPRTFRVIISSGHSTGEIAVKFPVCFESVGAADCCTDGGLNFSDSVHFFRRVQLIVLTHPGTATTADRRLLLIHQRLPRADRYSITERKVSSIGRMGFAYSVTALGATSCLPSGFCERKTRIVSD